MTFMDVVIQRIRRLNRKIGFRTKSYQDFGICSAHIHQHPPVKRDRIEGWNEISTLVKLFKVRISPQKRMRNIVSIKQGNRSAAMVVFIPLRADDAEDGEDITRTTYDTI